MAHKRYIMVDGPDGAGKGKIIEAARGYIGAKECLLVCEPTFEGIGAVIRDEIIKHGTGREYSALSTAQAYALEREILLKKIILPALDSGKYVISDRGLPASIAYQKTQARLRGEKLSLSRILELPGNKLALENAPGLLMIPNVDVETAMGRLEGREKKDNSIFEKSKGKKNAFQEMVRDWYLSGKMREIFSEYGTKVAIVDTGRDEDHTIAETIKALGEYIK